MREDEGGGALNGLAGSPYAGLPRRTLLRGAAAATAASLLRPWRALAAGESRGSVRVVMTNDTKKHEETGSVAWVPVHAEPSEGDAIRVDAAERLQPMLGFGSALTDASCFLLSSMKAEARRAFLLETYSAERMNLSLGRSTIGASDYSRDLYSYDDTPDDVEMKHFSTAHDEANILPMLREVRGIQPEFLLLSSPWSPPGWMKTYGSMLGGWMTRKYMAAYALYLSRFLEAYRSAGVPVHALTCQNEIEADQGGHMPATVWPPEMESDFIREHLGPLLRKRNDPTEIWLLDHNYELWKRVRWQMQDPGLRPFVSGVAWHGYVGTADQLSRLHEVLPELPFYWTEGGPDITDPKYAVEWTRWGGLFTAAIRNWCRAIVTWNLLLDARGNPNIGGFQCGGLVTLRDDGGLSYSGQYWTLRHFAQHVRRGAVRIASHGDASELSHVAFANPGGSCVLVVTNTGEERTVRVLAASREARVRLDRNSVTTLRWDS